MKHPIIKACNAARRFPDNTCSASRHAQMIGEAMVTGLTGPSAGPEDARDRGESILATVKALWEARTELARLNDHVAQVELWKNEGESLMNKTSSYGAAFALGKWWADRPWRNQAKGAA